jgi:hypothetical protein
MSSLQMEERQNQPCKQCMPLSQLKKVTATTREICQTNQNNKPKLHQQPSIKSRPSAKQKKKKPQPSRAPKTASKRKWRVYGTKETGPTSGAPRSDSRRCRQPSITSARTTSTNTTNPQARHQTQHPPLTQERCQQPQQWTTCHSRRWPRLAVARLAGHLVSQKGSDYLRHGTNKSDAFRETCSKHDYSVQITGPDLSSQNGKGERPHRTLATKTKCLLCMA